MVREDFHRVKSSFDDELGDDFLTSWKPSKSLAAIDFEDDEPAAKKGKAAFALSKMDTNFDFDFDGGLDALSKFNVDMSDLDLPCSREKTIRMKDASREKEPHDTKKNMESRFSFDFKGFDELDLDDTIKIKAEREVSLHSKKGERDSSPVRKSHEMDALDLVSDKASESSSVPRIGKSINKESSKTWSDSILDENKSERKFSPSNRKDLASYCAQPVGLQSEQISKHSNGDFPQKGRGPDNIASLEQVDDCGYNKSTTFSHCSTNSDTEVSTAEGVEHLKLIKATPQLHKEDGSLYKSTRGEKAAHTEFDTEAAKTSVIKMEFDGSSSDCWKQNLKSHEDLLDGSKSRSQRKESTTPVESVISKNLEKPSNIEKDEQLKSCPRNLKLSDEDPASKAENVSNNDLSEERAPPVVFNCDVPVRMSTKDFQSQKTEVQEVDNQKEEVQKADGLIASEAGSLPPEVSPPWRPAKRKFSIEETMPFSASKENISDKQAADEACGDIKLNETSESATPPKRSKLLITPEEEHRLVVTNPVSCRTTSTLLADRSLRDGLLQNKATVQPSPQSTRLQLGSPDYHCSNPKRISLVSRKSMIAQLPQKTAFQKKSIVQGDLRSPLLSKAQLKGSSGQLDSMIKSSSRIVVGTRASIGKQFQGLALSKTSGVALLSKTRATGTLRENCDKTFELDLQTSKGNLIARKDILGPKSVRESHVKQTFENLDCAMAKPQTLGSGEKDLPAKHSLQTNNAIPLTTHPQKSENSSELQDEICDKTFKLELQTSKGNPIARKRMLSPKSVREPHQKQTFENLDCAMAKPQTLGNGEKDLAAKHSLQTNNAKPRTTHTQKSENSSEFQDEMIAQVKGSRSHLAIPGESDINILEKSEYYADRLHQLLKELQIKYEEAMDLRVRAMVVNNSFVMLNNPIDDEKIQKIEHYVREKLFLGLQGSPVPQKN